MKDNSLGADAEKTPLASSGGDIANYGATDVVVESLMELKMKVPISIFIEAVKAVKEKTPSERTNAYRGAVAKLYEARFGYELDSYHSNRKVPGALEVNLNTLLNNNIIPAVRGDEILSRQLNLEPSLKASVDDIKTLIQLRINLQKEKETDIKQNPTHR